MYHSSNSRYFEVAFISEMLRLDWQGQRLHNRATMKWIIVALIMALIIYNQPCFCLCLGLRLCLWCLHFVTFSMVGCWIGSPNNSSLQHHIIIIIIIIIIFFFFFFIIIIIAAAPMCIIVNCQVKLLFHYYYSIIIIWLLLFDYYYSIISEEAVSGCFQ